MRKKVILFAALILTVILSASNVQAKSGVSISNEMNSDILEVEKIINDKALSKEIKDYLMNELGKDYKEKLTHNNLSVTNAQKIENGFKKKTSGEIIYPNYVGGLYIDSNNELVIQLVKNKIPKDKTNNYSEYQNIMSVGENKNIEYVDYSYKDLNDTHNIILNYFLNENSDNLIAGLYIDIPSNSIVVELNNYSSNEVERFKEFVIDSSMINFVKGQSFESIANLNPGSGYGNCSYGYRARLSGKNGIVTAAHCVGGVGTNLSFGTVKKWKRSGSVDAAWVETSNNTPTNTLAQKPPFSNITTVSTTVVNSFYVGQAIAKLGATTGFTVGNVSSSNYSGNVDGINHTNLVRANLSANNGDSGGIVIDKNPALGNNAFATAGITTAKSKTDGKDMLFTKASQINSTFGITRY